MPKKATAKQKPYVRPGLVENLDEPQELPDSSTLFRIVLFWRDSVHYGTIEERPGFLKNHMKAHFRGDIVSQTEMDAICDAANLFYERVKLPQRVYNFGGDFLPQPQQIVEVTKHEA